MSDGGVYGQRLGDRLYLDNVGTMVTRVLRKTEIAITEIRCDNPKVVMNEPMPREDSFHVALQMRDYPHYESWENGRRAPVTSLRAGDTTFYDLKRNPTTLLDKPFHSICFSLSRAALDALADEADAPRTGDLAYTPGVGVRDPRMMHLGPVVLAAMQKPEHANRLFVEHLTLAIGAHVVQTYGGLAPARRLRQGGLAPWQEKRAKDMIADAPTAIALPSAVCGGRRAEFKDGQTKASQGS
jgi:hypothetical protein